LLNIAFNLFWGWQHHNLLISNFITVFLYVVEEKPKTSS
jgi:hypothetical protein